MSTVDEEAAINAFHPSEEIRYKDGPVRPLESLADSSGYAIGAGLIQMVKELLDLNLCGTYSAGLTITQMQQHPSSQELWSQLMSKRYWTKIVGGFAMYFLTDHAQLVRLCMLALDRIDPKHFEKWHVSGSK